MSERQEKRKNGEYQGYRKRPIDPVASLHRRHCTVFPQSRSKRRSMSVVPKRSRKRPEIHSDLLGNAPSVSCSPSEHQVDRTIPSDYKSTSFLIVWNLLASLGISRYSSLLAIVSLANPILLSGENSFRIQNQNTLFFYEYCVALDTVPERANVPSFLFICVSYSRPNECTNKRTLGAA